MLWESLENQFKQTKKNAYLNISKKFWKYAPFPRENPRSAPGSFLRGNCHFYEVV